MSICGLNNQFLSIGFCIVAVFFGMWLFVLTQRLVVFFIVMLLAAATCFSMSWWLHQQGCFQ